jgi:hypothetical protein
MASPAEVKNDEIELCDLFAELPLGPITIWPERMCKRTFTCFDKLPAEIRVTIWKFTEQSPLIFNAVRGTKPFHRYQVEWLLSNSRLIPGSLAANHESRKVLQRRYPVYPSAERTFQRHISLRSHSFYSFHDILFFQEEYALSTIIKGAYRDSPFGPICSELQIVAINAQAFIQAEHWFLPAIGLLFQNLTDLIIVYEFNSLPRKLPYELVPVLASDLDSSSSLPQARLIDVWGQCCLPLAQEFIPAFRETGLKLHGWGGEDDVLPKYEFHRDLACREGRKVPKIHLMDFKRHDPNKRSRIGEELD